jgi:hypothetical protein
MDPAESQHVSIQLIALLEELYNESRGGAPDGPVRKSSAATDERAGLRGEYENFLIPQTPSDVISVSVRHSARGLRRRRGRWPALRTSRPATLVQLVGGAEGAGTRVVLLQLCLGIRAPTQGIFQYNNVLGSPSQGITTMYRRIFAQH